MTSNVSEGKFSHTPSALSESANAVRTHNLLDLKKHTQEAFKALDADHRLSGDLRSTLKQDIKILQTIPLKENDPAQALFQQSRKLRDNKIPWEERHLLANTLRNELHKMNNPISHEVLGILIRIDDLLREADFEKWDPVPLDINLIAKKVETHNSFCEPRIDKARIVIYETCFCRVQYDAKGILVFTAKPPVEQSKEELSSAQVKTIKKMANDITEGLSFNQMSILLDFVSYARQVHPFSWKKALDEYPINAPAILERYKGGDSGLVALALQEKLSSTGVQVQLMGLCRGLGAFLYPFPGKEAPIYKPWKEARAASLGCTHFLCGVRYKDSDKQDQILLFRENFTGKETAEQFKSISEFESYRSDYLRDLDSQSKAKEALKGSLKRSNIYQIPLKQSKELCELDLFSGVLSVSPGEHSAIPYIKNGKQVLPYLEFLRNPDEYTEIRIGNATPKVKKLQAVILFLDSIRVAFQLLKDFKDNMLFLMQNQKSFIAEVMIPPSSTMSELWSLYHEVITFKSKAEFITSRQSTVRSNDFLKMQEDADKLYEEAVTKLYNGSTEEAAMLLTSAKDGYNKAMRRCASLQHTPLDIMLLAYEDEYPDE